MSPAPRDRQRTTSLHIESWQEQDEHGVWWWKAKLFMSLVAIGTVQQSRVNRQRAEYYALMELADMLRGYDATTKVD